MKKFFIISFLMVIMPSQVACMDSTPYFTAVTETLHHMKQINKNYSLKSFFVIGGLIGASIGLYLAATSFKTNYPNIDTEFKEKFLFDDHPTIRYRYQIFNGLTIRYPESVECIIDTSNQQAQVFIIESKTRTINTYDFNNIKGTFLWGTLGLTEDSSNKIIEPVKITNL